MPSENSRVEEDFDDDNSDDQSTHPPEDDYDEDPECDYCGGPLYTQPHWQYWQCEDCGRRHYPEPNEP